MNKITFVPVGGLANRLRALASAIVLSQKTHSRLHVYWFCDWALRAPFSSLFQPLHLDGVHFHEASACRHFLLDRPRSKNLRLPRLYQCLAFRSAVYERSFFPLYERGFDFPAWVNKHHNVYMASYSIFQPYEDVFLRQLFIPIPEVMDEINRRSRAFTAGTMGVHVRRTDNIASIDKSPLEAFYARIDTCPKTATIFLATDSDDVKECMRQRYGERIITSSSTADRDSVSGIREGIIDMFLLSRTSCILGSFQSSFSVMAAQMGGIPLEVVGG